MKHDAGHCGAATLPTRLAHQRLQHAIDHDHMEMHVFVQLALKSEPSLEPGILAVERQFGTL